MSNYKKIEEYSRTHILKKVNVYDNDRGHQKVDVIFSKDGKDKSITLDGVEWNECSKLKFKTSELEPIALDIPKLPTQEILNDESPSQA